VDSFSYFIVFYSLILGLALAELLGGFALMVRAHALRKLEPQTSLVALLTLLGIVTEWVDSWHSLKSVTIDLAGLWAPVLLAISYYLAAAVVFPHRDADHERLADYYQERRPFIMGMILVASLLDNFTYRHILIEDFQLRPALFWLWLLPYKFAAEAQMVALMFVRSRRANIAMLSALILLFTIPYWDGDSISLMIVRHFGYR
jgi:hypothetical protein